MSSVQPNLLRPQKVGPAAYLLVDDSKLLTHTVRRGLAKEGQSVNFSSICSTAPLIPYHLSPSTPLQVALAWAAV